MCVEVEGALVWVEVASSSTDVIDQHRREEVVTAGDREEGDSE